MKNAFFERLFGMVKLRIKGRNIERFLKRLVDQKIELHKIIYLHYNEVDIIVSKKDYERIKEIKTIYDINIIDSYGMIKIKKIINLNKIVIIGIILGIGLLLFLSNLILNIEIIHTNKDLRNLLTKELELYGIKKRGFKKNYFELQKIKEQIILKHKDKIEWLEIESVGTKYIVRVQERKLPIIEKQPENRHIVASRNAIIRSIEAEQGVIVRNINDYVRPGDIIISGEIKLYYTVKEIVGAKGRVFGEVWYQTKVEYPFIYKEEKETGKKKKVLVLQLLNKEIELFNFKPFKNKKKENKILLENNWLPIKLMWQYQKEINIIEEINTEEEAINKAIALAREKMQSKLDDNEYIISQNCLKVTIRNSTIVLDMFYAVHEDITSYQRIEEIPKEIE
ncbi:MAG: hypothetical protein GX247_00445 [Mollicutes bacterium]|nr:hypothetical protein [Mollicutes bacterium]